MKLIDILNRINSTSKANFVQRLKDSNRKYIMDWSGVGDLSTHKLSYATDENGAIVYPNVQEINGSLHDFTDPKYNHGKWDSLNSAIEHGDTIRMSSSEAEEFTKRYKNFYPGFNKYVK